MVGRREFDWTIETAVYGLPAVMAAKNDMTEGISDSNFDVQREK
jgi:hypothetical protein